MNNLVLSLTPKFSKLQVLVLRQDKSQLQDNAVQTIANYCHDLQDLDLSKSFKLTDRSLYALAHGCPNLTKLNISGCSAFSDTALAYLSGFCRKIKTLNLCGCTKAASDSALKVGQSHNLLQFSFIYVMQVSINFYDNYAQAIGYNCTQLQYLNLGWCENVGDIGVMSLAYGCPDLRILDLCGCVLITGIVGKAFEVPLVSIFYVDVINLFVVHEAFHICVYVIYNLDYSHDP